MPSYNNNDYFERDRRGHEEVVFRSTSTRRRSLSRPRISDRSYTAELGNGSAVLDAENQILKTQLGIHEARTRTQSREIGRLEDRIRQLELAATVRERDYLILEDKYEAMDTKRKAAEEKARLLKRWTPTPGRVEESGTKERLEARIEDLRVAIHERDEKIRDMDVNLAALNLKVKTRDKSIAYLKKFIEDLGYRVDVNV